MGNFLTSPYYPIFVAAISGYLSYYLALKTFYHENQYQNKFKQYQILVDKMRSFIRRVDDINSQQAFANSYRAIWLFGSPKVIRLITKFYYTAIDSPSLKLEEKEKIMTDCLRKAVIEMRKDLNNPQKLEEKDFDFYV